MPLDLNRLESRLRLVDWREREFSSITEQLEAAFPALVEQIERRVKSLSKVDLAQATLAPQRLTHDLLSLWIAAQATSTKARVDVDIDIAGLVGKL